jgi:hypothetical protein
LIPSHFADDSHIAHVRGPGGKFAPSANKIIRIHLIASG